MTDAPLVALLNIDHAPEPPGPRLLSASQVTLWRECARKWAWKYIAKVSTPQNASAALGDAVDTGQLQPYFRERRPFDYTTPDGAGYIAASALAHLPAPDPGIVVQHRFELPSPSTDAYAFQGYIDLWARDGRLVPGVVGDAPVVGDFKTTKSIDRWAKTPRTLKTDVQAQLYAAWAAAETGATNVDLVWIYMQTEGARRSERVHLRVTAEHARGQLAAIDATAREMFEARATVTDPLTLPASPAMCGKYGGCPYVARCTRTHSEQVESLAFAAAERAAPQTPIDPEEAKMNTAALFANLAQRAAAPAPAPAPPAPAPLPAPAPAPETYTGPLDHPYVPKSPEGAIAIGLPPTAALPPALPINPPESALPPAPPAGASASTAEAPAPAKRGRPKKMADAKVDPETRALVHTENTALNVGSTEVLAVVEEWVEVTWAEERYSPVPYQSFGVGPFTIRGRVRTEDGETTAAAILRLNAEINEAASTIRGAKAAAFAKSLEAFGVGVGGGGR